MVRYRGLRIFRGLHLEGIFPQQRSHHFAVADARHFCAVVPDAAAGWRDPWHLCRSPWPQGVADDLDPADDAGHAGDHLHAGLRDHWRRRTDRGADRAAGAGIFRRRRIRQLDRVPGGAYAGAAGVHRKLAICQPGIGQSVRVRVRRRPHVVDGACRSAILGLADSVPVRRAGGSCRSLYSQPSGGRHRAAGEKASSRRSRKCCCTRRSACSWASVRSRSRPRSTT